MICGHGSPASQLIRPRGRRSCGRGSKAGAIPNEAYLILQTVVGAWPLDADRLGLYLEKALREAKVNTNWIDQEHEWEEGAKRFAAGLLDDAELGEYARRLAEQGDRVSLGMTLLKLTSPGVPDIYQGDELPFLALVDPDNRRPVDWELRRRLSLRESRPRNSI